MRIRSIKPDFFLDEDLARLDPLDRIVYIGLWCAADRAGLIEDRPERLGVQILPYEKGSFVARLDRLAQAHFIRRYQVDGKRFIYLPAFAKHQRPHHTEAPSVLPPPPPVTHGEHSVSQREQTESHGEQTVSNPLDHGEAPDGREGKGREGKGKVLRTSAHPADEQAFAEFWTEYPRKVGKGRARRVWARMSPEDRRSAVAAVKRYAAAWKGAPPDRLQFIKHPDGWLNGRQWEDDPADWHRQACTEHRAEKPKGADVATLLRDMGAV